ncbi:MAG: DEAD/DEAH box helicase [Blastochloris sp.]|nr:DEAD/DEAH box helicase [Blastochloris sp.]
MSIKLFPSDFQNFDRVAAEVYLEGLDSATRMRGRYYAISKVMAIKCLTPGTRYEGKVSGQHLYTTTLSYEHGEWNSDCNCPVGVDCKHACALMLKLIELAPAKTALKTLQSPSSKQNQGGLLKLLPEKFVLTIKSMDVDRIRRIESEYRSWMTATRLAPYVLSGQALRVIYPQWSSINTSYHSFLPEPSSADKPALTALEFWHFILEFARLHGQKDPSWIAPLNDSTATLPKIEQFKRSIRVAEWEDSFTDLSNTLGQTNAAASYALRLRFFKSSIIPEWFDAKKQGYVSIPKTKLRQLLSNDKTGHQTATSGDWLTWQVIHQGYQGVYGLDHFPVNDSTIEGVRRLLENDSSRPHVVSSQGKPLTWSDLPLTWSLKPSDDTKKDYEVTLETNDKKFLKGDVWNLPGQLQQPSYYVAEQIIYRGPTSLIRSNFMNLPLNVPYEALSTNKNLNSLIKLDCALPEELAKKVEVLRVKLLFVARVLPAMDNISSERFTIEALGVNPKNTNEVVSNFDLRKGWSHQAKSGTKSKVQTILIEDRHLHSCEALVKPLRVTWYYDDPLWTGYLDKKFPERFAEWAASLPSGVLLRAEGELASILQAPSLASWNVELQNTGMDWFDLSATLQVEDTTLTKEELKLLLKAQGGFVRLSSGDWKRLVLPEQSTSLAQLKQLGIDPLADPGAKHRLHALQLADTDIIQESSEQLRTQILGRALEIRNLPKPDMPDTIHAELRPYQLEGFHFLAYLSQTNFGGVLADDMGLGKTLQTLTWLAWLHSKEGVVKPSLVVCPKSVMDNWQTESARFYPNLQVLRASTKDQDNLKMNLTQAGLIIINYAQLRSLETLINSVAWQAVILDEGQFIKNPDSQTAQAARALNADHRLVLTGTPIENRLLDLWSLLHFAMPGALAHRAAFQRQYNDKTDSFARSSLGRRVRPFLLRRTKNQVARDLPERIEEDIHCELEGEQLTLYKAHLKEARQILLKMKTERDLDKSRFNILSALLRLRQACCHPDLIKKAGKHPGQSAKVDALMDLLEPLIEEGHKVLVFSQFVSMLSILQKEISERKLTSFYLDGSTENRGDLVNSFQKHEGSAVFLISLKAGGAGLNLTAASYVVLFDPWWNPAVEAQAIDRTHRIGQDKTVIAYRLIAKNTIEEKIRLLQQSKAQLFQDVLGEENFAKAFSLDDFQYLLADDD